MTSRSFQKSPAAPSNTSPNTFSIATHCANCGRTIDTSSQLGEPDCGPFQRPCVPYVEGANQSGSLELAFETILSPLEKLGHGSFGEVYKLNNEIAIKIHNVAFFNNESEDSFRKELTNYLHIETLPASLPIPKFMGLFKLPNLPNAPLEPFGIGMSLIPGIPLSKIHDSLSNDERRAVTTIIARKLKLLHNNGICHSDLQLDNMMIPEEKGSDGNWQYDKVVFIDLGGSMLRSYCGDIWEAACRGDRTGLEIQMGVGAMTLL